MIGTSCDRGGEAGIFIERGGTWQLGGPPLGSRSERAEVLGIMPSTGGVAVLLGLTAEMGSRGSTRTRGGTTLMAAWATAKGPWRTSGPLGLGRDGHVVSFGATPAGAVFTVIAGSDGSKELAMAREPGPAAGTGPGRQRSRVALFAGAASGYGHRRLPPRRHR